MGLPSERSARCEVNEATGFMIPTDAPKRRDLKPGTVFHYYFPKKDSPGQYDPQKLEGTPFVVDLAHYTYAGFAMRSSEVTAYLDAQCKVLWEPPTEPTEAAKPANPKQAYGDKKVATWAVPPALTLGAAKAFGEGAAKYGAFNWRLSKVEAMTYVGAMQRHLAAYVDGEDVDPESTTGKLHLEGIAACVGILLDCQYGGFLIDNRPPKGPAPGMVLTPKEKK